MTAALAAILAVLGAAARSTDPPSSQATLFGEGVFSTPADEFGADFAPSGAEAFFNRSVPRSQLYTIFHASLASGRWAFPEVASFSGKWRDFDPVIGPSGRLYFISDRPRKRAAEDGEYGVWYVDRTSEGWTGRARDLGAPVNGAGSVHFLSETSGGTLYVCASREGGKGPSDVYRVAPDGPGRSLENLGGAINGPDWLNLEAYVSSDESVLIVSAYGHEDSLGDSDLYGSRRCGGTWQALANLGPNVNSAARDYSPRITPDGKTLVFASERGLPTDPRPNPLDYSELIRQIRSVRNGLGNIYRVDLDAALQGVQPCGGSGLDFSVGPTRRRSAWPRRAPSAGPACTRMPSRTPAGSTADR